MVFLYIFFLYIWQKKCVKFDADKKLFGSRLFNSYGTTPWYEIIPFAPIIFIIFICLNRMEHSAAGFAVLWVLIMLMYKAHACTLPYEYSGWPSSDKNQQFMASLGKEDSFRNQIWTIPIRAFNEKK